MATDSEVPLWGIAARKSVPAVGTRSAKGCICLKTAAVTLVTKSAMRSDAKGKEGAALPAS